MDLLTLQQHVALALTIGLGLVGVILFVILCSRDG